MRKIIPVLILMIVFTACTREKVNYSQLVEKNGKVVVAGENEAYSGPVMTYYENGQLKFMENYRDGKKHGLYRELYVTGIRKTEGMYNFGQRDGLWHWWNERGEKTYEISYSASLAALLF